MSLNERAWRLCRTLDDNREKTRVAASELASGAAVLDFGVNVSGSLEAGLLLARICCADLAQVELTASQIHPLHGPAVMFRTDHPVAACIASQYAGWRLSAGKYFGMGSGPMRAAAGREHIIKHLGCHEDAQRVVGVLESAQLPPDEIGRKIANDCGVPGGNVTLCVAPTSSLAGTIQVVARSVETALHKLHELDFDLRRVHAGWGTAPLPPVAADDLVGIGRTNDAVLYGGQVTLWVSDDDERLDELARRIPSRASRDYGAPFLDVFQRHGGDFYKIDPLLFSPATVSLVNLNTGRGFQGGEVRHDILRQSFLNG